MSEYSPVDWDKGYKQAFHADVAEAGNLPSGVTLSDVGATGSVKLQASDGSRSAVAGVTVGDIAVATGRASGVASGGVDYTLDGAGPTISASITGQYYVVILLDRSDGTKEVLQQKLTVREA